MKKQDLIKILKELDERSIITIKVAAGWDLITEEAPSYCIEILTLSSASSISDFDLFINGVQLEHIKSDKPSIFYINLDDCKPNLRTLKMLEHTDWRQWLKDLQNNSRVVDIKLNFDPNAEFIPIF